MFVSQGIHFFWFISPGHESSPRSTQFISSGLFSRGDGGGEEETPGQVFLSVVFAGRHESPTVPFQVCVLLPLENLLWVKLRDYAISRVNPNPRQVFLMRVVKM